MAEQYRVQFDAEVTFQNGGRLAVEEFRLDIPGKDIGDEELAALFVRSLGLLMVGTIRIANKRVLQQQHKGNPAALEGSVPARRRDSIELSHSIEHGMVTYPGLPGPEISEISRASWCAWATRAAAQSTATCSSRMMCAGAPFSFTLDGTATGAQRPMASVRPS